MHLVFTKEQTLRIKSCLFFLNESLNLHIFIWYRKRTKVIAMERNWYRVHDLTSSFRRDHFFDNTGFSMSGSVFTQLKPLDFRSILCRLVNKSYLYIQVKMTVQSLRYHYPTDSSVFLLEFISYTLYHSYTTVITLGFFTPLRGFTLAKLHK